MAQGSHKYQPPKGTRDFYPEDMLIRRWLESIWREVSINHGFEEIDGPTFEHVELYKAKSGDEIVSEMFQTFSGKDEAEIERIRSGSDAPFALRPEFTPTLARMYAARAAQLPKPTKWFCLPNFFRAERPQRGRLREFFQWNIDIIGDARPTADDDPKFVSAIDAEVIAVAIDCLAAMQLKPTDVRLKFGNREAIRKRLLTEAVEESLIEASMQHLDARPKMSDEEYVAGAKKLGWSQKCIDIFHPKHREIVRVDQDPNEVEGLDESQREHFQEWLHTPGALGYELCQRGLGEWCEYDSMVVRGLAYYTGTVFEIHEASGAERAIAGGGRYDGLIELFGGPPTPAVGFAMGDVVIRLVLEDKGLLPSEDDMRTRLRFRADAFVIALKEEADAHLPKLVAHLRRAGLHARHSYRSTRNLGKLLSEAGKSHARFAVILGDKYAQRVVEIKNLDSGDQEDFALAPSADDPHGFASLVARLKTQAT